MENQTETITVSAQDAVRKGFEATLEELEKQVLKVCKEENPGEEVTIDAWRHTLFLNVGEGNVYYDVELNETGELVITDSDPY
jgi:hypothetical protein